MAVQTLLQLLKKEDLDSAHYSVLCGIKGKFNEIRRNNTDFVLLFEADEDNDFFPIFKEVIIKNSDSKKSDIMKKFGKKYKDKFGIVWASRNGNSVNSNALPKTTSEVMQIVFPRKSMFGGFKDLNITSNIDVNIIKVGS